MKKDRIPAPAVEFRHRCSVQIRFNDIDMFGHLNNSVYLQFSDYAKSHYFMQMMDGHFDPRRLGMVVANINCNFYAPTFYEEKIEVLTAVESIATSSLTMEQRIVNEKGDVKCIVRSVMVSFDPNTGESVPVTQQWRDNISAFEGRPM